MHDNLPLIMTITGGLAAALVMGFIAFRIGLPPMVGYLLAGILIGPYTPGFHADAGLAEQLAEIGIILLMFGVGLHFHFDQLMEVRRVAIPGAIAQSLLATVCGAVVARFFGWDWSAGIVFGLAISVASTVVLVRVLSDNRDLYTSTGRIAVGWLVVEDLFTVFVLVLLPAIFGAKEANAAAIGWATATAAFKIFILTAFTFVVGGRVIPWLFEQAAATRSRELFTLTVLVTALGIAVGSATLFGVTMALGAFLAGMVVGRSDFSLRAAAEALPMRDAFAVLFFVSVGMLFDPKHLLHSPGQIAAAVAVILISKPIAAFAIVALLDYPLRTASAVAVALSQIGEFSFIVSHLGHDLKILPDEAEHTLVAAAIITISLNPLLYRLVDSRWVRRLLESPAPGDPFAADDDENLDPRQRAVIVGYGPVGRTVARHLSQHEVVPAVVELNLTAVRALQKQGVHAVYGDADRRDVLEAAGLKHAGILILSSSNTADAEAIIREAREVNPGVRILARATYVHEVAALRDAGAEVIFAAEAEIALSLTEVVLRGLGASSAEIERERERVRAELIDLPPQPPLVPPSPSSADTGPVGEESSITGEKTDA